MVHRMLVGLCSFVLAGRAMQEPNPPEWPPSVKVFDPGMRDIAAQVADLYRTQDMFGSQRTALLFKPGTYNFDVPVGYYTQVLGLGRYPSNVKFTGRFGVHQAEPGANSIKFWRGVENVANLPSSGKTVWSVSQAAPLRRMHVVGDLLFGTESNTQGSGGFISNVNVSGIINFTMQQQWIVRNSEIGDGIGYFEKPTRSVNFVFVGAKGAPRATKQCTNSGSNPKSPRPQTLVIDATPVIIEKPYISMDGDGKYMLVTPKLSVGSSGLASNDEYVDGFEKVFVATNITGAATINSKLDAGLHVVLAPGVYHLSEPIRIGRRGLPYQTLLGLGLATLVPTKGNAALEIEDSGGVRVAGIIVQAGPVKSDALIRVGASNHGDMSKPCLLADVFSRVGDPLGSVGTRVMMEINASNVILDNVWLWRGDVGGFSTFARDCDHALVVNGHNVTAYGLAAEHVQSDNVVWNGEGGRTYFYQAELDSFARMPSDHTPDYGANGVSGYRVNAKSHLGIGVGVYVFQGLPGIFVQSGVKVLHKETVAGFVCPFYWNFNPAWWAHNDSAIESAIATVADHQDILV